MKYLILNLIFTIHICQAQSSLFIGANTTLNSTSLYNKEDRKVGGGEYYKSKIALSTAYGLTLGYSYKNKLIVSFNPNYMNFKHNITGKCDTGSVNRIDGYIRFKTINFPIMLGYNYQLKPNLYLSLHAGIYYTQVLSLNEKINIGSQYEDTTWRQRIEKTIDNKLQKYVFPDGSTYKIVGDEWLYKKHYWGFTSKIELNYSLSDKFSLNINIPFNYSFKDIENKKTIHYHYEGPNPAPSEYSVNYWNTSNYARYYGRPTSEISKRPSTYTQAIGLGIGINYYFKGGLLPSIH